MAWARWLDQALLRDLPVSRRWSYLCFSMALLIALGSHQFVGPVKTAIFMGVVGTELEPVAKSLVLVVLLPVLILYSMLVSLTTRAEHLVVMVCSFYAALYLLVVVVLAASNGHPSAWLAWVLYYATETKGVIVMPMVWSVITDVTRPELAKKAYPIMFFAVQIGGILGSLVAIQVSDLGGEVSLLLMQTVSFAFVAALAWAACRLAEDSAEEAPLAPAAEGRLAAATASAGSTAAATAGAAELGKQAADRREAVGAAAQLLTCGGALGPGAVGACAAALDQLYTGMEGLWLLVSRPYVFMTFWVSYANLMPRTVLDYQNSVLGVAAYEDREAQIAFFGKVNMLINSGTALLTLLGTRPIVEFCGVGFSLLFLPVGMLLCLLAVCLHYGLWTSTWSLVLVCILAYGLNSPCKEMLYVRTSREIKYKAKSWSEMYGNQLMKLLGAQMNLWVNNEAEACHPHCFQARTTAAVAGVWVALWFGVAFKLGAQHRQLEREDSIVT